MAVTPDLNQIATVMSQLQHNYSQLAQNWFDIFYNPNPKDVSITFYDELGNLETYSPIPNRAKDFTNILSGTGSPETSVIGNVGAIYQDLLNGEVYLKKTGTGNIGWIKVINETELNSIIKKGGVEPEGSITGTIGDLYVDNVAGKLYLKSTGTGNTGWVLIGAEMPTKISDLTDDTSTNPVDKADTLTGLTATVSELNVLDGITATTAELNYTDGVTSNIQTQLDETVKTSGNQTISGIKTFTGNPVFQGDSSDNALTVRGETATGISVRFENSGGYIGDIGIDRTLLPIHTDQNSSIKMIVRGGSVNSAVGSITQPIYINASGVATPCTSSFSTYYLKTAYVNPNVPTSGYRIWSDGYCEQWGQTEQGTSHTITFLKAFSDTSYCFIAGTNASIETSKWQLCLNKTGIWTATIHSYDSSIKFWRACGFLYAGQY